MLKELIKLANHLDEKGYRKEADLLDSIMKKFSEETKYNAVSSPLTIKVSCFHVDREKPPEFSYKIVENVGGTDILRHHTQYTEKIPKKANFDIPAEEINDKVNEIKEILLNLGHNVNLRKGDAWQSDMYYFNNSNGKVEKRSQQRSFQRIKGFPPPPPKPTLIR